MKQALRIMRDVWPFKEPNENCCEYKGNQNGEPDIVVRHPDEGEDVVLFGEVLHEDGEAVPLTDDRNTEVNSKGSVSLDFYSRPTYVRSPLKNYEFLQKKTV